MVPTEARRGSLIPWTGITDGCATSHVVLGIEPWSSRTAASALTLEFLYIPLLPAFYCVVLL